MKKRFTGILALVVGFMPAVVTAVSMDQGSSYGGVQVTRFTYDEDDVSDDAHPTALTGRLGYFVGRQIALEGRLGIGLGSDRVRVDDFGPAVSVDFEITRLFGFYVVGYLPLSDVVSLYGLFGFSDVKAEVSANGFSGSDTDSGISYGLGAEFFASQPVGLNLEYVQYLDETGYDLSGISVGVTFNF